MKYSFTWKGTACGDKGITLQSMPEIIRPEERVRQVTVPGRSGDLTLTEGENIYNSYIQDIPVIVGAANLKTAEMWLTGDGYVTFSCEPNRKQRARIINAVSFKKFSRNSDDWTGDVQFYCEPIKYATSEAQVEITTSGTAIDNPGDLKSFPLIAITGSGIVTVAAGGRTLTIPECENGWVIDCENEWILSGNTPLIGKCSGMFPVLNTGNNVVTFTGATKLTITPRFRYI